MAIKDKDKMVVTETRPMGVSASPHDHEHEERDVNIPAILWALGGIAVTVGVVCLIVWGMFTMFESRQSAFDIPASPVADTAAVPPQPRLQAQPSIDMAVFRAHTDSVINHYGWVDRPAGIARMPIDSAISIVARQGVDAVRSTLQRSTASGQREGDSAARITPLPVGTTDVRSQGSPLEKR